jgi:predicted nucleic acid-binding protein
VKYLLDSNVLLRLADSKAAEHAECTEAVTRLAEASHIICVCAQVIIESYVVASRPVDKNGLGFTVAEARQFLADVGASFPCLPEPPDIGKRWTELMMRYTVAGKQAHDARIAALMIAHGITHLLTLNPTDFARYSGITAVTPHDILHQ